jgi:hypothetical protein
MAIGIFLSVIDKYSEQVNDQCGGREDRGVSRTPDQKSTLCWDQ